MTPKQTEIVKQTWSRVAPIADTAATLFYDRLFELDPTTRPLFKAENLPEQRRKLMQTLDQLVRGLDRLDDLVPAIEELGRRHVGYGVRAAHYDTVGAALLWTLEQGLGEHWTPEAQAAWTDVYALTAGVMRNAASGGSTAA